MASSRTWLKTRDR
ncbi:Hypothetical protein PFREUD_22730 [Propionibacterium freudenreichii subsp. shermanii CIRM-BIA1]|uniref:Uncharacterized protein n=1 Tax=Propionibacterium freudenreichii subsp. shermanii (strain ATCC 9614 / DSM 4902 / CIP 103027 / NCIMB 8099 / CIRM-BIA1) TaxID=754252 RepID=D7GGX0_PROFC|nr:Hypothetical protein PFREUD_22730 [Propionibacterium freudenreichii subsp. shermanii CIRM-BIA1]